MQSGVKCLLSRILSRTHTCRSHDVVNFFDLGFSGMRELSLPHYWLQAPNLGLSSVL
jgi:hypothetical protein